MDSTISHTSLCVSVKSTITIYIFWCVCPRLGVKKTDYEKKKREGPRSKVYTSMCVCMYAFVSHVNRGGQLVCTRLHTGESGRHSETVELRVFILPLK